jgi:hypothetical protein
MKRWQNNYLPALAWVAISLPLLRWHLDPLGILMGFRAALVLRCFLIRVPASHRASHLQIAISWLSSLVPFALSWHAGAQGSAAVGTLLVIAGALLVGLACIDLGDSFGISPAVRPFVAGGVYHWVRNPMYLGHVLAELGVVLASPTPSNLLIVSLSWLLYLFRIKWESALHRSHVPSTGSPSPCPELS